MKLKGKVLDYAINFCVVSVGQAVGMGLYQGLQQAYYMATWKEDNKYQQEKEVGNE